MNLLFNQPLNKNACNALEQLTAKYDISGIYAIKSDDSEDVAEQSSLRGIAKYRFDFMDSKYGRLENFPFYDELPPLDAEILDKMSQYEPEALKMLERAGRIHDSAERRMIQYHQHLRYWNYFLDRAQIDVFITFSTPHCIYDYILFRLCQIKGILVIFGLQLPFQASRRMMLVKNSYEISDASIVAKIEEYKAAYDTADDVKLGEAAQREYDLLHGTGKQLLNSYAPHYKLSRYWELFKSELKRAKGDAFARIPRHIKGKQEINGLLRYYARLAEEPDLSVPYIYFPLHYQPEETTSPAGGWFVHQYLAIQMLSYHAPPGVWIYVKEHPVMMGIYTSTRVAAHYDLIVKLKNVKLIPIKTDTIELTKHAAAVSSITGSVGYEAMYQHKPYIMFGNQAMRYGPGTLNVRNNEDCRRAMARIFDEGVSYDDRDIKTFLKVMEEVSCNGTFKEGGSVNEKGFTEEALAEFSIKCDEMLEEHFGTKAQS